MSKPEQVFALAEKYFGPIARGPATLPVRTVEPEQSGERRVEIGRRAQNPLVQVAWHGINADDPRAPALNLLQTILTEGDASRLNRVLVEERKLAVDVGSGWPEGFDPSIYTVYATLAEGASTAEYEKALNAEIARLVASGVTDAELARAKNQVAAAFWRGVSTLDGRAQLLGEYAVMHGDYRKLFAAPAAYESGYGRTGARGGPRCLPAAAAHGGCAGAPEHRGALGSEVRADDCGHDPGRSRCDGTDWRC